MVFADGAGAGVVAGGVVEGAGVVCAIAAELTSVTAIARGRAIFTVVLLMIIHIEGLPSALPLETERLGFRSTREQKQMRENQI
jgi:hypothetical protein